MTNYSLIRINVCTMAAPDFSHFHAYMRRMATYEYVDQDSIINF
jgi:hypothetical protein